MTRQQTDNLIYKVHEIMEKDDCIAMKAYFPTQMDVKTFIDHMHYNFGLHPDASYLPNIGIVVFHADMLKLNGGGDKYEFAGALITDIIFDCHAKQVKLI